MANIGKYDGKYVSLKVDELPFELSYKTLMMAAGEYVNSSSLTEEQQTINDYIDTTKSFNIVTYAYVTVRDAGWEQEYYIDNSNYDKISVNGNVLAQEVVPYKSVALYDVDTITVSSSVPIQAYHTGDKVYLYFSVEAPKLDKNGNITSEYVPVYLCLNIEPPEEEEEEEKDEEEEQPTPPEVPPVNPPSEDSDTPVGDTEKEQYVTIIGTVTYPEETDYVYINSMTLKEISTSAGRNPNVEAEGQSYTLKSSDKFIRIHFNENYLRPIKFNTMITMSVVDEFGNFSKTAYPKTYKYTPSMTNVSGNTYTRAQKMNTPNVSYGLLRANPKLTGNVKVVIDSKNNIYLDTFKVSKSLEQKRFRHVKVNSNEYYGQTLMTKYKDVPTSDFYKIEDKCYNLFTTAQTYNSQYYDLYRYGVKTNDDKMYSENFALLAPLCIKEVIPDFFVVFKIDTTKADYKESWDDTEKMQYFLKNGTIVKSYDMRKDSILGEYVRTIYNRSNEYPGDAYLSYSETNNNRFIGISVDRGVVTSAYESPFEQENIQSQVAMNDFLTEGFERNHLVSKNIINFEFMFNDTDAELFSIDTYFGLYIKVNTEDEDFSCIGKTEEAVKSNDEESEEVPTVTKYLFDSSIHTFKNLPGTLSSSPYSNILYGLTTPKEFVRLNEGVTYAPELEKYVLKPYKNILSAEVRKIKTDMCKSFLSFRLNRPLEIGDHIRIADIDNKIIYEVVTTNLDNYTDDYNISDVTTAYSRINSSFYTIKYVSMFISSRKENDILVGEGGENPGYGDIVNRQVEQLYYAFKKFNSESFAPFKYENSLISIVGKTSSLVFERICSPSGFTDEQKIYLEEDDTENDTIEFFNGIYPDKIILNVDNVSWQNSPLVYLYPLHFEVVGNRMAHAITFLDMSSFNDEYLYAINIPSDDVFDYKTLVYNSINEDNEIVPAQYNKIKLISFAQKEKSTLLEKKDIYTNYVSSFFNDGRAILNVSSPYIQNNIFNLYNSYPLNSGVCSIFNLKDFDFDVLDNNSYIAIESNPQPIGEMGEFAKKSIFNQDPREDVDVEPITTNGITTYFYGSDGNLPEDLLPIHNYTAYYHATYGSNFIRFMNSDGTYPSTSPEVNEEVLDFNSTYVYQPLIKDNDNKNTNLVDYTLYVADYVFEYNISTIRGVTKILNDIFYVEELVPVGDPESDAEVHTVPWDSFTKETEVPFYVIGQEDLTKAGLQVFLYYLQSGLIDIDRIKERVNYEDSTAEKKANVDLLYLDFWKFMYKIGGWKHVGIVSPRWNTSISTGYSAKPIRNTSEENIKDYIDKHRSFFLEDNGETKKEVDLSRMILDKDNNYERVSSKYFNTLFENNHVKSDISLTSPHVCKWKGIGTDARGENMRIMYDYKNINPSTGEWYSSLVDSSSYYAVGSDTYSTYLGFLSFKGRANNKKYIPGNLNDLVANPNNPRSSLGITEKQYILTNEGSIEDILYSANNNSNKFSVAYNAGEDTIEFISSGIKFRLRTSNNDALNLSNYNGYSAVFVSLPDINRDYARQTELIIDEIRKEIMLVWYQAVNTFEFGKSYDELENSYDLYNSIYHDRYICRVSHDEDIKEISCAFVNGTKIAKVKDDAKYGEVPVYTENGEKTEFLGKRLCRREGGVWIGSVNTDNTKYTKYNRLVFTGEIYPNVPARTLPADYAYSYYMHKNYLTVVSPVLWHNELHGDATNSNINNYCYEYNPSLETFLITDDPTSIPNKIGTFDNLKNAIKSCAIYVKTPEGRKDYTTFTGLLNIEVLEPIKYYRYEGLGKAGTRIDKKKEVELGYVHPSYAEPVTIDMFNFDYSPTQAVVEMSDEETSSYNPKIEDIFEKSFDGANVVLSKVNAISQMWFNKYTEEFNYCIKKPIKEEDKTTYRTKTSLGVEHKVSIMKDSWNNKLYRNYSILNDRDETEIFNYIPGYKTGYELKTFVHSRGINLNGSNGNTIEIISWKNTEISTKNNYIRLDITDSLVYNILFRQAFSKYWKYLNLSDNTYKINYIKNTILPLININNKTKFVLYKDSNLSKYLYFNSDLNEDTATEIINYKNELKYENGKYYMYVYPEDITGYYAKMIINL